MMGARAAARWRWVALGASGLAAVVVVACTTLLLADQVQARSQAVSDEERLATLQEEARLDAEAAATLNEEQKQLADQTLARRARRGTLVSVLIGAALVLVVTGKLSHALAGWRAPTPEVLAGLRAADLGAPPGSLRGADWPALDLADVDAIVAREGTSREAAIPILNALLARYGYLPDDALRRVCEATEITPAQIAGNSTFYANFRRSPVGRHVLRVCHGTACHVAGSRHIEEELRRHLEIGEHADTDPGREFTVDRVACVGCCSLAPVVMIGEWTAGRLTPERACRTVDGLRGGDGLREEQA
jgi:NADH:ubiquinone oxidoreductase subunit E